MNEDLMDITIVLDRSGSMAAIREDTVGGFNTLLDEHKAQPGSANLTTVQFDDHYDVLYEGRRIQSVPSLTAQTFVPRGSTALLDAVGRTLNATGARLASQPESGRAGKVLFVIMTDGMENASHEFSQRQISEMITHQREKYSWEIVFIGANQDAEATAAGFGLPASNALSQAATPAGTRRAYNILSKATTKMRARTSSVPEDFFSAEDKV